MEKIYKKKLVRGNVCRVKNLPKMYRKQLSLLNRNVNVDAGFIFIKENNTLIRQKK